MFILANLTNHSHHLLLIVSHTKLLYQEWTIFGMVSCNKVWNIYLSWTNNRKFFLVLKSVLSFLPRVFFPNFQLKYSMKVYNGDLSIDIEQLVRLLDVSIQWHSAIQTLNVANALDMKTAWLILDEIWTMDQELLLMEQNTFHLLIAIHFSIMNR